MSILLLALLPAAVSFDSGPEALAQDKQDAAPREQAGGFVFSMPKDWKRRDDPTTKVTYLAPPGLGFGQECSLVLYPTSQTFPGTAQELHDAIFKSVTAGSTIEGDPETGKAGLFQSTRAKVKTATGQNAWMAVYTAKSGATIGGAVFVAGSEALFKTHGAGVERLIKDMRFAGEDAPAAAAGGQAIHGLVLPLPAGWTRKDDLTGAVALTPPPPKSVLDPRWDYVFQKE